MWPFGALLRFLGGSKACSVNSGSFKKGFGAPLKDSGVDVAVLIGAWLFGVCIRLPDVRWELPTPFVYIPCV